MDTLELSIEGMTCGSCVQAAKRALSRVQGAEYVDVRLQDGTATVRGEGVSAVSPAFLAALAEAGYPGRVSQSGSAAKPHTAAGGCGSGRSGSRCCCGH